MGELKPCPLCDGQAKLCHGLPSTQNHGTYQAFVRCKKCGCKTKTFFQLAYESKADVDKSAKDSWNRRVALENKPIEMSPKHKAALAELVEMMNEDENKPLTLEQFEAVCESVHNGWWEECKRQGRTNHPDMKPYDELPESVKDYDRVTVQRVLDTLEIKYIEMEEN